MNASLPPSFSVGPLARRPRRGAFALVITLLILSLLVVVAVSYLSSMVGERQTADAYTSKTRAEELAQAGADSAMAILKQSFRDFPDSATVWDPAQSTNDDGSSPNEGTSLYLRAVPDGKYANPFPAGTAAAANDANGNDPNNPACKNFVLPLISGVPGGRAQLVSNKGNIFASTMNAKTKDPALQNYTDLNVRRGSGDTQGVIGSPPGWGQNYPKPARAYWVPLKSKVRDASGNAVDGPVTGRYAFWVEDESFRANDSYLGNTITPDYPGRGVEPPDNTTQPTSSGGKPRGLLPGDATLLGPLTQAGDTNASNDAVTIFNTRKLYPGQFFPDPLAFVHTAADGTSSFSTDQADRLRYLLTNQSGTLNLTRHGTQRFNLNGLLTGSVPAQTQVNQIVQAMKFHLPYLGQRFYRTSAPPATPVTAAILNDATQVPGSPVATGPVNTHSNIYFYKVAANLLDYIDADSQPTVIDHNGNVLTANNPPPGGYGVPINGDASGAASDIWAQGKEGGPYLQEVAIRLRPIVYTTGKSLPYNYDLKIDYYVEFWNMSNRDIYASGANASLPNLGGATLHITDQQTWVTYPSGGAITCNDAQNPNKLTAGGLPTDYHIDLTNNVFQLNNGSLQLAPNGVVFKAGACTVITTDPDFNQYLFKGITGAASTSLYPTAATKPSVNTGTTYYCQNIASPGQREYQGSIASPDYGLKTVFRESGHGEDDELEITLSNGRGYIDSVPFALSEHGGAQWTGTDKYVGQAGNYNDYSYSSCLFGNYTDGNLYYPAIPSELGDPRTNNEQLSITQPYDAVRAGDQSRYIYGSGADTTLGYPNAGSQKPDQGNYPWPDYYVMPPAANGVTYPAPDATTAPMVVANAPLTSIGQLGDVYDPARLPGTGGILYSRGGGRTFKIGQHDDRYSTDPTGTTGYDPNKPLDTVSASNAWASWRLADVFDAADPAKESIESPARININGVLRDGGAALLSLLQGFKFQPATAAGVTAPTTDPVIHGDGHGSAGLAGQTLDTSASASAGFAALISQMKARLTPQTPAIPFPPPANGPSGPFFERGELGELGTGVTALFGLNPPSQYAATNKLLVGSVDTNRTFDHSREELVRRIAQMICTRGDTFTVYAVGQSIAQATANGPLRVTGTHRMRVTFRLVPKAVDPVRGGYKDFHPSYDVDGGTGAITPRTYADLSDTSAAARFGKPDHYDVQILQTATY